MPQTQMASFMNTSSTSKPKIMYIPSCNNRIFADSNEKINSHNAIARLLEYMGYQIIYPEKLDRICCGQVFDSDGNAKLGHDMKKSMNKLIHNSPYPVLLDNSSCVYNTLNHSNVSKPSSMVDIIEANLHRLKIKKRYAKLAVHIDCSSKKLRQDEQIICLLKNFADELVIPHAINCCGFAGNKGFITPELNQAALSTLAGQITNCDIGVTFNRNCQIGLSLHGQKTYVSLAELVLNCL